jgi:outer membrane lipoprotein-sorting protein
MKKLFLFAAAIFICTAQVVAQNADVIIDTSRNRIKADTVLTQSRMVIAAKNGSTTGRTIKQASKDDKDGNARIIIEFLAPAGIKGVRFLTIDKNGGGTDQWIYLPALNKSPRRIDASEGSKSFQGTDLSHDDISSTNRKVAEDTNTILREESLNGNACYVIQSIPKDKSYQYSKIIQWIDKQNNVNWKMELYDQKGVLKKVFEVKKLEDKQGRLTPMESIMTSIVDRTSTTIYVEKIQYDGLIDEGVFTTKYLETGRP